ncbi:MULTISPECIES: ComEA family DNA-binding protein [Shewanella]|uniref:ComEA family DNA-binding protein n=1 Tax=Shewanella TaxID=22 RepID=UPI00048C7430|nr:MULTISPECIES: ComEA family DNA-binding protein [Shewanella]QLE84995.1 helix-hairpin-helix domain-containing protein [Shewanella sp. Scap07]
MKSLLLLAAIAAASVISPSVVAKESLESTQHAAVAQTVNINTATLSQLAALKGVGEVKAQAIIDYRRQNGQFTDINQLANVKGIGSKFIETNRANIKL